MSLVENSRWINVYCINKGSNLLKFDASNKKWAFNLSPAFTDETKTIFEDFLENNLVVK